LYGTIEQRFILAIATRAHCAILSSCAWFEGTVEGVTQRRALWRLYSFARGWVGARFHVHPLQFVTDWSTITQVSALAGPHLRRLQKEGPDAEPL